MKFAKTTAVTAGALALVAIGGAGAHAAGGLIHSNQIAPNAIHAANIKPGAVTLNRLSPWVQSHVKAKNGAKGATGAPGAKGAPGAAGAGFQNAYYATAKYDVGDTNGGAIATVACNSASDTAVSGGVQTLGLGADTNPAVISSSFPGRMDWSTNTPKADRLDGWIVQFANPAGAPAPGKVTVWAMCVPNLNNMSVDNTYTESGS